MCIIFFVVLNKFVKKLIEIIRNLFYLTNEWSKMYKRRNTLMYDIRKGKEQNFKIIYNNVYDVFKG